MYSDPSVIRMFLGSSQIDGLFYTQLRDIG